LARSRRMDVGFQDEELQLLCNVYRRLVEQYGDKAAALISCRLHLLKAAPTLGLLPAAPPICLRRVKANGNVFTVALGRTGRIHLKLCRCPRGANGAVLWKQATKVKILTIEFECTQLSEG
jgi:hypothetical protein